MPGVIEDVARALDPEAFRIADRYTGRLTALANARGVLRALLSGPVGDVLRAALDAAGNAEPLPKAVLAAAEALPSEITDMLGGE